MRIMNSLGRLPSPLENSENKSAIDLLKLIAQSSLGPRGHWKVLQNACGGHVTVTSSSQRLVKILKVSNPYNKLVISTLLSHLKIHNNDGLYIILLTLEILSRSMMLDIQLPLISAVCQKLQHNLATHLETCSLRLQVNFDNLSSLLALTKSILTSKPACSLNDKQRNHLSCLTLKCFLNSVPKPDSVDEKIGTFHFISQEGLSPDHCQIFDGILIEAYDKKHIATSGGFHKCALFHVSLSGDVETSLADLKWTTHDDFNVVNSCIKHIMNLCSQIVKEGVSLVACQKVIHPRAKQYLTNYGIVVLDRLGQLYFEALQDLTGASPIESFVSTFDPTCLGNIGGVSLKLLNKKYYYHLQKQESPVNTLFLTNYTEESVEELKVVCGQAISALRSLLSSGFLFCGGGCLETHMAAFLRSWCLENMQELVTTGANMGQVVAITDAFAKSFETIAMHLLQQKRLIVDKDFHHCWPSRDGLKTENDGLKCACGLLTKSDMLLSEEFEITRENSWDVSNSSLWKENEAPPEVDFNSSLIVDAAWSKREAIKASIETFLTMLQIDCIIDRTIDNK